MPLEGRGMSAVALDFLASLAGFAGIAGVMEITAKRQKHKATLAMSAREALNANTS